MKGHNLLRGFRLCLFVDNNAQLPGLFPRMLQGILTSWSMIRGTISTSSRDSPRLGCTRDGDVLLPNALL